MPAAFAGDEAIGPVRFSSPGLRIGHLAARADAFGQGEVEAGQQFGLLGAGPSSLAKPSLPPACREQPSGAKTTTSGQSDSWPGTLTLAA